MTVKDQVLARLLKGEPHSTVYKSVKSKKLFYQARVLRYAGDYVGADQWDVRIEENQQEKLGKVTRQLLDVSLGALHSIWQEETA